MIKTNHPNVYHDLRHKDPAWVYKRFPGITETCAHFGIDIAKDKIPVRPGAHYSMGGVLVDAQGRTNIRSLWAAGEVSSTGLHGANRLASNSLLENKPVENRLISAGSGQHNDLDLADIRNSLKSTMWRLAGVVRDEHGLEEALQNISHWSRYVLSYQFKTELGWELQNMLTVSRLIVEGALNRRETRGSHNRSDYPDMAEPAEHTIFRLPE